MEDRQFRLRVTYGKTGRLAMLSHLEVTHALERIVRRSGLPFALSCGFSPHMKMAFGSALPVGIGGTCEIFDLTLSDYVAPAKALDALKRSAPADMMPVEAEYVEPSAKAASVANPFSMYEVRFDSPVAGFEYPSQIEVVRKKKAKTLQVADYLVGEPVAEGCSMRFQLESKDTGSLRPDVFVKSMSLAFDDGAGSLGSDSVPGVPAVRSITRTAQSPMPL